MNHRHILATTMLVGLSAVAIGCVSVVPTTTSAPSTALPSVAITSLATQSAAPSVVAPSTVVTPTPTAPPTPTATVAATASPTATATPTETALATPSAPTTPSQLPSAVPTAGSPSPQATLDFSLEPNYGSATLSSGFIPDPHSVTATAGGSVETSYLGASCTGYATAAPDYSVSYTSGSATLLRFYFVANESPDFEHDPVLIINGPSGTYECVDDSYGTFNPTIDFAPPTTGKYDVWVASRKSGNFVAGTLYVTELDANHPE